VNKGGGQFQVPIYDNNYPNQTRAISFDTKRDTWYYDASTVPNQPDEIYQGNSSTKSMILFPTSPGLGIQKCPFCGKVPSTGALNAAGQTEEIYLAGGVASHGNLVVTDGAGHHAGVINGKLVDQIPGASVTPIVAGDWTNQFTPDFSVPADQTYTLSLNGAGVKAADNETMGIVGPGFDVSVSNISMQTGDKDQLVAAPFATSMSYTSSRVSSPTFKVGVSNSQADYAFVVNGLSSQANKPSTLLLPAESGNLTMKASGGANASGVNVTMTRYTRQGTATFSHGGIALAGGDSAQLQFGNWTNSGQGIPLAVTHKGQQSIQTLANQPGASAGTGGSGAATATGPAGPAGPSGSSGPQGPTGPAGQAGTQGAAGGTGPAGPQGPTGATGPSGPRGPAGPGGATNAWQGTLSGGIVGIGQSPTLIVRTPSLPAGHFMVTAELTVAGSARGNDRGEVQVDCWVTPNRAGISSNADGVRVSTDVTTNAQSLNLSDLITTAAPDQIDLVCRASPVAGAPNGTASVTNASIIATQISNVTKTS
jgi:hypothetical protein